MSRGTHINGNLIAFVFYLLFDVNWVIFLRGTGVKVQSFWSIFLWYLYILCAEICFLSLNHAWYFWSKWCQDCKCFYLLEFCGLFVVWDGRILFYGQISWVSIEYLKVVLFGPCIVYVLHIFFCAKHLMKSLLFYLAFLSRSSARSTFIKRDFWSRFVGAWPSGM